MPPSDATGAPAVEPSIPLTRFIGRDRELDDLVPLVEATRLLTLTGAGGSGKTRLAHAVAQRVAPRFERVIWADLAPLGDAALVPERLLAALRVPERAPLAPLDAVMAAVGEARVLLVLDNCEHVVDASAAAAEALLRACPALVVLATSREALGVGSETAWLVPPLAADEAVQLFIERARASASSLAPRPDDLPAIEEICRRLAGIPLAIELAAARVRVLPPAQIASRLHDALGLLTTGSRTALPRHRTLRATLDWSHALLSAPEQALLRRLAVFAGGFTLESAEAICAGAPVAADAVLDVLSALVDKSLVGAEPDGDTMRYHLLETVRQYARERLDASGETDRLRAAHARHYLAFAEEAEPHLFAGAADGRWIGRVQAEADNLRVATQWAEEDGVRADVALRIGFALHWFWWATGQCSVSRHRLGAALALDGASDPVVRGRALLALGFTMTAQGDVAGGRAPMEEAARLLVERDEPRNVAYLLACLAAGRFFVGDAAAALDLSAQALARVARVPEHAVHSFVQYYHARAAQALGDTGRARAAFEAAIGIGRRLGHRPSIAHPLTRLGQLELAAGDVAAAAALLAEGLEIHVAVEDAWGTTHALEGLAAVAAARGQHDRATAITAAADALRARIHVTLLPADQAARERRLDAARAALGARFDACYVEGTTLPLPDIVHALRDAPIATDTPIAPDAPPPAADDVPDTARLRVLALGPLQVWVGDRLVEPSAWGSARPRELLVHLLLHPEGRTKEQVGLAFWPDASPAQLRNNFHVTLHRLRRALGRADWITLVGERYVVDPAVVAEFDVARFEAELAEARRLLRRQQAGAVEQLAQALARVRGDLLDGEPAGDWHLAHRDHLQRLHVDGLMALGEQLARESRHLEAADAYRRVLARDELHEGALQALMRCHAAAGDRTQALRAYQRFADRLRDELASEPQAATLGLAQRLQRGAGG